MKLNHQNYIKQLLKIILFLFSLTYLRYNQIDAHASVDVSKYNLPYEITNMYIENNQLYISGWAYTVYQQHYLDQSTHSTQFKFFSDSDSFIIDAELKAFSQTLIMEYFGSPTCSLDSINTMPEICNFYYENVGFEVHVPLERFISGQSYQSKIISNAFNAAISYQTDVYYPMSVDLILENTTKRLTLVSRLDDTNLTINSTTVLARKEPSKTGEKWFYGTNCSTTYLNQLYFLKNTVYKNVYEKVIVDDISFYKVKANLYLCNLYRRRIIEGLMFDPVWIASPYVTYSGTPLTIYSENVNQAPKLNTMTIEIFENESFNIMSYVSAYDPEEGDISERIILLDTNYQQKIGTYYAIFSVSDLFGLTDQATLAIIVKEIPNFKPNIHTQDTEILQYSDFNPMDHVSATDIEDGDITNNITVLNEIDTWTLGYQNQCFSVEDSKKAYVESCMIVKVISYTEYANKFRFVSIYNSFMNENIPTLWINKEFLLNDLIKSNNTKFTLYLD